MGQFAELTEEEPVDTRCKVGLDVDNFDEADRERFLQLAADRKIRVILRGVSAREGATRKHLQGTCTCPDDTFGKGAYRKERDHG